MESYIERMDELIVLKKDKGHKISEQERKEYAEAWTELVAAENGFTAKAEKYFYEGFDYTGTKCFVAWALSEVDSYTAMEALIKGTLFGGKTKTTFSVLVSVLANLLQMNPEDENLICPVIKVLPRQSKTKEAKTLSDAGKVFVRYYVDEMKDFDQYPALYELSIKPIFIREFVSLCDELIGKMSSMNLKKEQIATIAKFSSWVHPESDTDGLDAEPEAGEPGPKLTKSEPQAAEPEPASAKPEPEAVVVEPESAPVEPESEVVESEPIPVEPEPEPVTETEPEKPTDPYDELTSLMAEASNLAQRLRIFSKATEKQAEEEREALKREVADLSSQLTEATQNIALLETRIAGHQKNEASMQLRMADLVQKITELERRIEELQGIIADKDSEIEQRVQMMEVLSRDRAKQSDEFLNKLASELRVEYRDFRDAESIPMDADLGENMREQLKSVFAILEKAGIKLN